ncbi:uncharacterized protein AKAME5_000094700 [Lates japonicus]|uniref:Uncharacterized protein n=1 Tax=Lates japonicus TaxID=270547 RepID=A0AAD3QWZ7_LATJO|nr:uncharacterized protein AKAME5_000094700 [Lates japonicus]
MQMRILVLVSAVALLASPAVVSLHNIHNPNVRRNLKRAFELAENCSASCTKNKFFCKVQEILDKHQNVCEIIVQETLTRTLKMYNIGRNVNCTLTLQGNKDTLRYTKLPMFFESVIHCLQTKNFMGS